MPVANKAKRVKRRNKEYHADAQGWRETTMFQEFSPTGRAYARIPIHAKANNKTKLRGVAQLVARQFRVLEAASSSPATSTKKITDSPCGCLLFFRCGEDENSPFAPCAKSSSHSK